MRMEFIGALVSNDQSIDGSVGRFVKMHYATLNELLASFQNICISYVCVLYAVVRLFYEIVPSGRISSLLFFAVSGALCKLMFIQC